LGGLTSFAFQSFYLTFLPPFRRDRFFEQARRSGVDSLPIVSLLALFIGIIMALQTAVQMQRLGSEMYIASIVALSLVRELGPVITALVVAGRVGAAFAAEIGSMQVTEQIDALETLATNPLKYLVVPRFLALLITLPALSFIADITGLVGGGFMAITQLDISAMQYISRVQTIATPTMFFIGMIKAPVFALLITAVCTYQGMSASGSAENVGKITTIAVVQSIFLVIMADAVFSIVFAKAGI